MKTTSAWKLPRKFKLLPGPRLDPASMAVVESTVARLHCKMWYLARGIVPPSPPLHPAVMQLIAEWFDAVDEDGSRTLEHSELLAALKAAHIPCNDMTITEMIKLMDINGDGVISWDEFKMFMADEISNGKNLMTGEYILPSGATMNFGVVIGKLKRDKLMKDVLEDIDRRSQWAKIAADPRKLSHEVATIIAAAKAAADINKALESEMTHDDVPKLLTPRTQAAQDFLGSVTQEARVARSLSRAASRQVHAASGPQQSHGHAALFSRPGSTENRNSPAPSRMSMGGGSTTYMGLGSQDGRENASRKPTLRTQSSMAVLMRNYPGRQSYTGAMAAQRSLVGSREIATGRGQEGLSDDSVRPQLQHRVSMYLNRQVSACSDASTTPEFSMNAPGDWRDGVGLGEVVCASSHAPALHSQPSIRVPSRGGIRQVRRTLSTSGQHHGAFVSAVPGNQRRSSTPQLLQSALSTKHLHKKQPTVPQSPQQQQQQHNLGRGLPHAADPRSVPASGNVQFDDQVGLSCMEMESSPFVVKIGAGKRAVFSQDFGVCESVGLPATQPGRVSTIGSSGKKHGQRLQGQTSKAHSAGAVDKTATSREHGGPLPGAGTGEATTGKRRLLSNVSFTVKPGSMIRTG